MRQLMHHAAVRLAMLRWWRAVAIAAAALFWITLGGGTWPAWLQLAASGGLAAAAARSELLYRAQLPARNGRDRREWLRGYLAALDDVDPEVAQIATAGVIELHKRRPR